MSVQNSSSNDACALARVVVWDSSEGYCTSHSACIQASAGLLK